LSGKEGLKQNNSKKIKAILFDLDGTLLNNDIDVFLSQYFKLLTPLLAHIQPPDKIIKNLMQAANAMVVNNGKATNEEVFWFEFTSLIGRSREELENILLEFYANQFPILRQYTSSKPKARQIVQQAFDQGYDVVIATTPVFPAIAIEQRLKWADIADFPYQLVTSIENSRACKPNLIYYEQILESIGHEAEACLMVGDEDRDMVAAHLGCTTFLITSPRTKLKPIIPEPTYNGTLTKLGKLLQSWK
jgi:FMN phosphatase YigB (HAD superfamily)